jgi:hypothetical protein
MYRLDNFDLGLLRATLGPTEGPKSPEKNKIRVYIDLVGEI